MELMVWMKIITEHFTEHKKALEVLSAVIACTHRHTQARAHARAPEIGDWKVKARACTTLTHNLPVFPAKSKVSGGL